MAVAGASARVRERTGGAGGAHGDGRRADSRDGRRERDLIGLSPSSWAATVLVHVALAAFVLLGPSAIDRKAFGAIEFEVLEPPKPEPPPPVDPELKEPETAAPEPEFIPKPPKPAAPLAKPLDEPPPSDEPPPPVYFGMMPGGPEGSGSVIVPIGSSLAADPSVTTDDLSKIKPPADRGETGGTGTAPATAAPAPPKPVSFASLSKPPKLKREVRAPYPPEAKDLGVEGIVVLRVDVGNDGKVRAVKIVTGLGHGLDEAAMKAVREFLFEPAVKDGAPVATVIPRYEYEFILD